MTTAAAAWFAVVFFMLPGALVAWLSGLKLPAALAAALPVSFGVFGFAAWLWGTVHAPLNVWTYGFILVVTAIAAVYWRRAFARRAGRRLFRFERDGSALDPYWLLPGTGVAVGAFVIITDRLKWLVHSPNGTYNVVQGWDVQWHANLVRFIRETGVASPARMGELMNIETHAPQFYPSAYHAGVALYAQVAGLEPVPALNIASTVLPGLAFPISMTCLAFAFLRSTGLTAQIAGGLAAILVYSVPQLLWIPEYVGMWPYLFAVALTGAVIWLFASVPGRREGALTAGVGLFGVLCVHPSAVTIVVVAVVLIWLTSTLVRPDRTRLKDTAWLAAPAATAAVVFLPQAFAGGDQATEVAEWQPTEKLGADGAWGTAFKMTTRHVADFFPAFDATVWLWLAGAGALVCVLWRGQIWPVLFYGLSLCATAQALEPMDNVWGDLLAVVSNLHYNTGHRLIMPVAMCLVVGSAIAIAAAIRLVALAPVAQRYRKGVAASTVASMVLALAVGGGAVAQARSVAGEGAEAAYLDPRDTDRMVGPDDLAAFDWLASQPAAWEGLTMGDPSNGHSWIYALKGVPTVSRHYQWPAGGRGSATGRLNDGADFIGEGSTTGSTNTVDQAVEDLNVKFYILRPGTFWAQQNPRYESLKAFWLSKGVTPVYRKGETAIFAVNSQFSKAELREMRKDAKANGSDELPELEDVNEVLSKQATAQTTSQGAQWGN